MNEERPGYWRWLTRNLSRLVFSPVVAVTVGILMMVICLAITVGLVVEYGSPMFAALTGFLGILGSFILIYGIYREEERLLMGKRIPICFRIDEDLYEKLRRESEETGLDLSDLINLRLKGFRVERREAWVAWVERKLGLKESSRI